MANVAETLSWSLLAVILLPINILCLLVILHTKRISKVTKLFLLSLTFADLDVCTCYVIPAIGIAIYDVNWPYGDTACLLQAAVIEPHFCIVVLTLFAVNLERFIAISYPLRYPQIVTFKRSLIVLISIWALVIGIGLTAAFINDWNAEFFPIRHCCSFNGSYIYFVSVQECILILTLIMYARIVCIIRKHNRNSVQLSGGQRGGHVDASNRNAAKTMCLLTLSALVCMLPGTIVLGLNAIGVHMPSYIALIANLCFASSGIWDALLYFAKNKTIKKATLEWFMSCKSSTRSPSISK